MVDEINNWLQNGCNYDQGVSLYAQYGDDNFFLRLLTSGESSFKLQKLIERLTGLRDKVTPAAPSPEASQIKAVQDPAPEASQIKAVAAVPETTPGLPPIMSVKEALKKNYAELTGIHPHLHILPEGEDLRKLAVRVLRLGKQNAELWERYNYYTENPEAILPGLPPPPAPVMIDANLLDKRELLRKSLNKAENRIKGIVTPKKKTLELIAKRRQELADLDAHIAQIRKDQEK